jgi:hypothetical protein
MVRPNKTKPEGYMWPLDVPDGYPHALHCTRTPWPGFESRPGLPVFIKAPTAYFGYVAAGFWCRFLRWGYVFRRM